jgi:hypothetical protein
MVFDVNVSERAGIDLESSQPKIEDDRSRALDETGQLAQIPNTALLELISKPAWSKGGWVGCTGTGFLALGPCHVGTRKRAPHGRPGLV